ncbi:MAG TPA: GNAT family protein [Chitinophagaceae bacterium]|jgi:RimJ/RimL family protein N-acetyltransferase|nr:GNAT family protein [Chitinophagaceae bacterium]
MKIIEAGLTLETNKVLLRPIEESDFETFLHLAQQDQQMWEYFSLNLADEKHLRKWMDAAFADTNAGTRRPFTIIDKATSQIAGSSSMGNIAYHDLRVEIGWSWLGKNFRSTGVNRHAKYSMMRYAFEELNFERVEFKTDVLNERAKQGLRKVGGKEEGVLRSHMTMWNNRRRDSIYFSVLKNEWPGLKESIFSDIVDWSFKVVLNG